MTEAPLGIQGAHRECGATPPGSEVRGGGGTGRMQRLALLMYPSRGEVSLCSKVDVQELGTLIHYKKHYHVR